MVAAPPVPRERAILLVPTELAIDGAMKYALSWQHVLQIGAKNRPPRLSGWHKLQFEIF